MEEILNGFVTFAEELSAQPVSDVRRAAELAGLDPKLVRDIKGRNAFIRTTRELQKQGVIETGTNGLLRDKLVDDDDVIVFQFSKRFVEANGAKYDREAVLQYTKSTGEITCPNEDIKMLAFKLFAQVQELYSASDINAFVKRVVESNCKRILMRDGVYFVPVTARDTISKISRFYRELGFDFTILPVNHSDGQSGHVVKAVVQDIKNAMSTLEGEINTLSASGDLTARLARNRIKDLQVQLKQYQDLAESLRVDMSELVSKAGAQANALVQAAMPVDALIQAVQKGEHLQPLVFDLLAADPDQKVPVEALKAAIQQVDLPSVPEQKTLFENKPIEAGQVDLVKEA